MAYTFVRLERVGSRQSNTVHVRQHALPSFIVVVRRSATMFHAVMFLLAFLLCEFSQVVNRMHSANDAILLAPLNCQLSIMINMVIINFNEASL